MTPRNATNVCAEPGCPTLITGTNRCPEHRTPDHRGSRGYSLAAWQAARSKKLRGWPYCQDCMDNGLSTIATEVDHLDGLGPRGPHGTEQTNLRSLCKSHHSMRTARDHPPGSRTLRGVA